MVCRSGRGQLFAHHSDAPHEIPTDLYVQQNRRGRLLRLEPLWTHDDASIPDAF